MKKEMLSFPLTKQNYLPNVVSRRIFGSHKHGRHVSTSYKSDGGEDEEALLKRIKAQVEEQLKTRATKEEIKDIMELFPDLKEMPLAELRALANAETGAMKLIADQGIELRKIKEQVNKQVADMSVRAQIKAWQTENRSALDEIKGGTAANLKPLEIRVVASPMLPANTISGAYLPKPEFAPGIVDIMRPEPIFWDFLKKGRTNSAAYVWVNKKNKQGAAAFIAPGIYKPGISFELGTEISNAKKIAVSAKMATELLEDIDGFASYVEDELRYELFYKVSTTLLATGVASTTVPASVRSLSVAYTDVGVKTTNPNYWDALAAAVAKLRLAHFKGRIVAVLNPVDLTNMRLTKAVTQGQIFIPPAIGASIVEDENVPVGSFQLVAVDYWKTLIYKDFSLTWGWENDDFTKNLVTVIAEMRLHSFFSENHTGFAIYDTFAAVIALITPAP